MTESQMTDSKYFKHNIAVVIGINNYNEQKGIPRLNTAEADAERLADILKRQYGYEVIPLLNEKATRDGIWDVLTKTLPEMVKSDQKTRLIFYFAGHGTPPQGEDGEAGYLVPQDASSVNLSSFLFVRDTQDVQGDRVNSSSSLLSMKDLHDKLIELKCHHLLVILDCCFSGGFRFLMRDIAAEKPEELSKERYEQYLTNNAYQVLASAAHDQKALDSDVSNEGINRTVKHSPFAEVLFEALDKDLPLETINNTLSQRPADYTRDGITTATELYTYLSGRLWEKTQGLRQPQVPQFWPLRDHKEGEFIFLTGDFDPAKLPDAPTLDEKNNPYRGLESFEEAHSRLFFGRQGLVEKLNKHIYRENHPFTVVLGASGSGKSSLVKAGLLPDLRQSYSASWQILEPMRPGTAPFNALAKALLPLTQEPIDSELKQLDEVTELIRQARRKFSDDQKLSELSAEWRRTAPEDKLVLVVKYFNLLNNLLNTLGRDTESVLLKRLRYLGLSRKRLVLEHFDDFNELDDFNKPYCSEQELIQLKVLYEKTFAQIQHWQENSQELKKLIVTWCKEDSKKLKKKLLLVIDQFEELVTRCSKDERVKFLNFLKEVLDISSQNLNSQNLRVIATLRADFEPSFSESTQLKNWWKEARFLMQPMQRQDLQQAIEGPALEHVLYFEKDSERGSLVDQLLNEVDQMPGALPLLSFTLSELYRKVDKKNRTLTWKDYKELGGVTGSLTQRATETFNNSLDKAHQATAQRVILRMVLLEGGKLSKRQVLDSELNYSEEENAKVEKVKKVFIDDARLLVTGTTLEGEAYIEPAHDALIREWKQITTWLEEKLKPDESSTFRKRIRNKNQVQAQLRFNLTLQRQLGAAARQWERNKQDKQADDWLWDDDPRLPLAAQVRNSQENNWLNLLETEFVDFSVQLKRFRQHRLLGSLLLAIVVLSGLTIATLFQLQLTQWQAQAGRATNLLGENSTDGLVLAIQTLGQNRARLPWNILTPVQTSLLNALAESREKNQLRGHIDSVVALDVSRDGQTIVSAGASDRTVRLWNLQGDQIAKLKHSSGSNVMAVAISPDSHQIVSGSSDGTVYFWGDSQRNWRNHPVKEHSDSISSVIFSPNGELIASSGNDGKICLWNLEGHLLRPCFKQVGRINSIAFSPDGQTILSGGGDGTVRLWDLQGNFKILQVNTSVVWAVAFHPDGQLLVAGTEDRTIYQLDLQGRPASNPLILPGAVKALAFSPDGELLSAGSGAGVGAILTWDLQGNQIEPSLYHGSAVRALKYSSDSTTMISGGDDQIVHVWDTQGNQIKVLYPSIQRETINNIVFSPDRKLVATSSRQGSLTLYESLGFDRINQFAMPSIEGLTFNQDGTQIITNSSKGLQLWNFQGELIGYAQEEVLDRKLHDPLAMSPDGKRLATVDVDGIRLWQVQDTHIYEYPRPTNFLTRLPFSEGESETYVKVLAFSPDGQIIASGSEGQEGRVALWNLQGQLLASCTQPGGVTSLAFSPGSQIIASGGQDRNLYLWNRQCRQIRSPLQHSEIVSSIAFGPNKKLIASGSWDGVIRFWDFQGNEIGPSFQHPKFYKSDNSSSSRDSTSTNAITALAFSPDGEFLMSGSFDGTVRIWHGNWEAWLKTGCNRLRYHPVFRDPQTKEQREAKGSCERFVWHHE